MIEQPSTVGSAARLGRASLPFYLIVTSLLIALSGCETPVVQKHPLVSPIPANSFAQTWFVKVPVPLGDKMSQLYALTGEDLLFAYTQENRVYALTTGGRVLFSAQVGSPGSPLRAPIATTDRIIFPTADALEIYTRDGTRLERRSLGHSTRGPAYCEKDVLYVGLDYPTGERLAAIDLTKQYGQTLWEVLVGGALSGAATVFDNVIYAGSEDGRVWAISNDGKGVWPDPGYVTTGGVVSDVKADSFGVYAASLDTKLYCFNRIDGQIKWAYFSGQPLRDSPIVTHDIVYQHVPNRGLAAVDKSSNKGFAKPKWICHEAHQWLAQDADFVYASGPDGQLLAIAKADGAVKFHSAKSGYIAMATNQKDSMLYIVSPDGTIRAVRPVLRPGEVGIVVMAPPDDSLAAAEAR